MIRNSIHAAIFLAIGGVTAHASDAPAPPDGVRGEQDWTVTVTRFHDLDGDGDGYISRKEIERDEEGPVAHIGVDRSIVLYDLDSSGQLDVTEYESYRLYREVIDAGTVNFSELDMDGDGVLSRDEMQAVEPMGVSFAGSDRNGDGKVDRYEYVPVKDQSEVRYHYGSGPS